MAEYDERYEGNGDPAAHAAGARRRRIPPGFLTNPTGVPSKRVSGFDQGPSQAMPIVAPGAIPGLEVKPGQMIKCEPEDDQLLHLSQGALGESKKDDKATMYVKVGDKKLSSEFTGRRPAMSKAAAALIGLSWAPKLPSLPVASGSKKDSGPNPSISMQESLWKPSNELVDGLFVPSRDPRKVNKLARKDVKDTTGKGWFDMSTPSITPALKKDFEILQLRHVMDPKRHFKRSGKTKALPKYFQVGTVIEPAYEFFSSRLTKRERKTTLADELLSDQKLKNYRMRKVREIQETRTPGGNQKWKNKGRKTFKRAKDRRK